MLEILEVLIKNAKNNKQRTIRLNGKTFGDLVYSEYFAKEMKKLGYKIKLTAGKVSMQDMIISW